MKCNKIAHFIGKNRKYVYPKIQSPFFWKGFRVGFCPPSSVCFLPSSVRSPLSSILCLLSVVFLFSCAKSSVREQLERAEQVMETDSRAASAVLDSIDSSALRGEEAALYAILRTQTDYKNYKPLTSDSLVRIATDYYGTPLRKNYHAAMAWYTLGCVYTLMQEDLKGIDANLKAKDLFPDTLNRYYSLCLQNLGKLYMIHYMYPKALEQLRAFKRLCAIKNDSDLMVHADYLLGMSLMRSEQYEEANACYDDVWNNSQTTPLYHDVVMFQKAKIYLHGRHDCDSALYFINKYQSMVGDKGMNPAGLSVKGDVLYAIGELDSAYIYHKAAVSSEADLFSQCNSYRKLAELSFLLGKDEPIHDYTEKYTTLLDSVYRLTKNAEITSIIRDHEDEMHAQKATLEKRTRMFINLFLLTILAIVVLLQQLRKLKKVSKWQKEDADTKIQAMENTACPDTFEEGESDQEVSMITEAVPIPEERTHIYETRKAMVENSRSRFEESRWGVLYKLGEETIMMGEKQQEELKKTLNELMADLQWQLYCDCLDLNRDDIYVCCLAMLGLSKKTIAYCMGTTEHAIYCRATKLRSKLTPEWLDLTFYKD